MADSGNAEIFDPDKAKKKKKKKVLDLDSVLLGTPVTPAAAVDDAPAPSQEPEAPADGESHEDILDSLGDFGTKKKKKKAAKKIDLLEEEGVGGGAGPEGEEDELNFGSKKKKKKGKVLDELVLEEPADGQEEGENEVQFDEAGDAVEGETTGPVATAPSIKSWLNSDRDYTYDELLDRVFEIMRAKNPEMVSGTKQKFVMRPPQVVRIGTKKTSFVNFMEICKMLHRHQKHLLDFLLSELGTSGSIDGNNQLIIKGRFQQKQIENVLRRYIKEYVTCHTCRSPNTLLQKDFRLFFLQCEACGSRCSVASIKLGFVAQVSKRAAMRAKAN